MIGGRNKFQLPPLNAPQQVGTARQGKVLVSPLRPSLSEVTGLLFVTCIAFLGSKVLPVAAYDYFHILINSFFGLFLALGAARMLKANSFSLMTALFWFRIATVVYFAFGTAYVSFTTTEIVAYLKTFYPFSAVELLRFNQLMMTCTTTVIATLFLIEPRSSPPYMRQDSQIKSRQKSGTSIGLLFLIAGTVANLGFVIPYNLSLTDVSYASWIGTLSQLRFMGIFLSVYFALKTKNRMLIPVTAYCVFDMSIGVLTFSKSPVLMVQIVYLLPFLIVRPSFRRVLISVIIVLASFLVMQSVLSNLRSTFDNAGAETFQSRLDSFGSLVSGYSATERQSNLASFARFSFVNAGTFVMDQYDRGFPSDWPKLIPAVAVPRAFWPEKPIITQIGVDLYSLSHGGRTSSSASAGYFAEAYWAGGWTGSIVLSVFLALVLRILTRFTLRVFYYGNWLQLITVLLAMRIGFRVDGHYIADVFGALVYVGFFWGFMRFVKAVLSVFNTPNRTSSQHS